MHYFRNIEIKIKTKTQRNSNTEILEQGKPTRTLLTVENILKIYPPQREYNLGPLARPKTVYPAELAEDLAALFKSKCQRH